MSKDTRVCPRCGDAHPSWYVVDDPVTGNRQCGNCSDDDYYGFVHNKPPSAEWKQLIETMPLMDEKDDLHEGN